MDVPSVSQNPPTRTGICLAAGLEAALEQPTDKVQEENKGGVFRIPHNNNKYLQISYLHAFADQCRMK